MNLNETSTNNKDTNVKQEIEIEKNTRFDNKFKKRKKKTMEINE